MIVKDVMTKNLIFVYPETSITEAKAIMTKKNISKLPVLDKNNQLVGLITKNDMAKAGPSDATSLDMFEIGYLLSKLTVEKFMTKKVVTVSEDEVVEEAARIMVDNEIGCVPVMKNDLVVGIVTESDLFHLFTDKLFFTFLFPLTFENLDINNKLTIFDNDSVWIRIKKNDKYEEELLIKTIDELFEDIIDYTYVYPLQFRTVLEDKIYILNICCNFI